MLLHTQAVCMQTMILQEAVTLIPPQCLIPYALAERKFKNFFIENGYILSHIKHNV
jgi:hypothetical protein